MRKSKRHANTSSRFYLIISRLKQFLHIWNSQYKRKENILNTFSLIISSSISLISLRMAIALILEYLTILLCMHIYIYIARTKCKMCHQWITVSCIKMIVFFFWVKNYLIFHEFFFYFMISGKKNHIMHERMNIYICVCMFVLLKKQSYLKPCSMHFMKINVFYYLIKITIVYFLYRWDLNINSLLNGERIYVFLEIKGVS